MDLKVAEEVETAGHLVLVREDEVLPLVRDEAHQMAKQIVDLLAND